MRIARLDLIAFGPFTGRSLVLDPDDAGFHLIHGPNEAGKSAALRGLKALLYGVPGNTLDDFVHDKPKLRVGGLLRNADGRELDFVRRKGRLNTLLDSDGEPLDEQCLSPFLHGVGADVFETLFGIDHPALVKGGREILEHKGEVGQALFSAALGSHALHRVLAGLRAEADELFRPRGSTQRINAAVKRYDQLKKTIQQQSLSSREWREHRLAKDRADEALAEVERELREARAESHRLKRIRRVLPGLARRRVLREALQELGDVVVPGEDFSKRHGKALHEREKAQAMLAKTRPRLEALQQQLSELKANPDVQRHAERVEALHAGLGAHRKALRDSPGLRARHRQLLADAEALLKTVRPGQSLADTDDLRRAVAKRQRITELGQEQAVLEARLHQADDDRRAAESGLEACRRRLAALPEARPTRGLHGAIDAARKLGDIDAAIQSTAVERDSLRERCEAVLSRLAPWRGGLGEVAGLATPDGATLDDFEQRYAVLETEEHRLRDGRADSEEKLREVTRQLDEMLSVGDVPDEADLDAARARRDRMWQGLRDSWSAGETLENEASDQFTRHIQAADELADRLRREADRVQQRASLQASQASLLASLHALEAQREDSERRRQRLDDAWRALWSATGIQPLPPREMRAWLGRLESLRERLERLRGLEYRLQQMQQQRETHVRDLFDRLRPFGAAPESVPATLETVLRECEASARQADEEAAQRAALEKDRVALESRATASTEAHARARLALEAWRAEWRELLVDLALPADATPAEADDIIETLRSVFDKQAEADQLRQRLRAIDDDAKAFTGEVAEVAAGIDAGLADLPAEEVVPRLNALLSEARAVDSQRRQIGEQIAQHRLDIQEADAVRKAMADRLDALCREVGCDSPARLEQAERRVADHHRLVAELGALERELEEAGEGIALTELEQQAARVDADSLPAAIKEHAERIDALEARRTELAETRGREARELECMDGGATAAEAAEQAQAVLAGIRADAERYLRASLAERILRDQIERYRRENQGPLLRQASDCFARLTLGSFERLAADFNEKDQPILSGIRANGESVTVAGMSAGTRDQLYLALRLASLEKYMQAAEPMPFIVDDILIEFDDQRSAAALQALAGLAEKTQVILFTHHDRLVEQARELQPAARIHKL